MIGSSMVGGDNSMVGSSSSSNYDSGRSSGRYTAKDREYVRYCLRYAVRVLGHAKVLDYLAKLDEFGDER